MAFTASYRIEVWDFASGGAKIGEIAGSLVDGLTYSEALNERGAIDFVQHVEKADRSLLVPSAVELRVYRSPPGGPDVREWGGYLWEAKGEDRDHVRFAGEGYLSRLERRYLDRVPNLVFKTADGVSADQVNIAWALINYVQSVESYGFTRTGTDASNASGIKRDMAYCYWERRFALEAIQELAGGDDSFDFAIGMADKVWRTWYPRRGATLAITLDADADGAILSDYVRDGTEQATEVTGQRPCSSCDGDTGLSVQSNATAKAAYGLLQKAVPHDVRTAAHLDSLTREDLRISKDPREQAKITFLAGGPARSAVSVGDVVTAKATRGYVTFNRTFRVVNKEYSAAEGIETVAYTLDSAVP